MRTGRSCGGRRLNCPAVKARVRVQLAIDLGTLSRATAPHKNKAGRRVALRGEKMRQARGVALPKALEQLYTRATARHSTLNYRPRLRRDAHPTPSTAFSFTTSTYGRPARRTAPWVESLGLDRICARAALGLAEEFRGLAPCRPTSVRVEGNKLVFIVNARAREIDSTTFTSVPGHRST